MKVLYIGEQNIDTFAQSENAYGASSDTFEKQFDFMKYKAELMNKGLPSLLLHKYIF